MRIPIKIIIGHSVLIFYTQTYCMENTHHPLHQKAHEIHENIGAAINIISPKIGTLLHGEQPAIANNKYKDKIAYVQHNPGISVGECKFLSKRLPIVKAALEKKLNRTLTDEQIPTIAIIGSGGGYRAMLYFTATLHRAYKIGLLDALTYISALSGSTWAVAPWISTGMPLEEFKPYIQECASKPLYDVTHKEKILITDAISVKKTYDQPRTIVDLYGDFLGNRLLAALGDTKHMTYLSNQIQRIKEGLYPYPIYVAIDGRDEEAAIKNPTVYEYTAYTISEHTNNTEIPSWGDGRKYKRGQSTNTPPEKSLAYDLATWGSAFGANIKEILEELLQNHPELLEYIEDVLEPIEGKRIIPCYSKVPNYMYKMDMDTITDKTLLKDKTMIRVDAGLENNLLDFSPVSGICPERAADILIIIDISAGKMGRELERVTDYAHKHNVPFPTIDLTDIDKKTISIFNDEHNKKIPTAIYMPRISDQKLWEDHKNNQEFKDYNLSGFDLDHETNDGFAVTQNFQYTVPQSTLVMNQAEFNFHVNEDKIWQAIEWKINQKS